MPANIWFPFYAAEYLSDTRVALLTLSQRGVLIQLWCHLWKDGPLPNNLEDLVRLTGGEIGDVQAVVSRFLTASEDGQNLVSQRMAKEKLKAETLVKLKSKAGKLGNQVRWPQEVNRSRIAERSQTGRQSQPQSPKDILLANKKGEPTGELGALIARWEAKGEQ